MSPPVSSTPVPALGSSGLAGPRLVAPGGSGILEPNSHFVGSCDVSLDLGKVVEIQGLDKDVIPRRGGKLLPKLQSQAAAPGRKPPWAQAALG